MPMPEHIHLRLGGADHDKLFIATYAKRKEASLKGGQKVTPLEHAAKVLETKLRRFGKALGALVHLRLEWVNNKSQLKHLKNSFDNLNFEFKSLTSSSEKPTNIQLYEHAIIDARKMIEMLKDADADKTKTQEVKEAVDNLEKAVKAFKKAKEEEFPPLSSQTSHRAQKLPKASEEPSPRQKQPTAQQPGKTYSDALRASQQARAHVPSPMPTLPKTVVSSRAPPPLPRQPLPAAARPAAPKTPKESGWMVVGSRGRPTLTPAAPVHAEEAQKRQEQQPPDQPQPVQIHPSFFRAIRNEYNGKNVNLSNPRFREFIQENLGQEALDEAMKRYGNSANFHLQLVGGEISVKMPKEHGKAQETVFLPIEKAQKEVSRPVEHTVSVRPPVPPEPPAPPTRARKEEPSARGGTTGRRGLLAFGAALLGGAALAASGRYLYDPTAAPQGTGVQMEPFIDQPPFEEIFQGQSTPADPNIVQTFPSTYGQEGVPTLAIAPPPSIAPKPTPAPSTAPRPPPAPSTVPKGNQTGEQAAKKPAPGASDSSGDTIAKAFGAAAVAGGGIYVAAKASGKATRATREIPTREARRAESASSASSSERSRGRSASPASRNAGSLDAGSHQDSAVRLRRAESSSRGGAARLERVPDSKSPKEAERSGDVAAALKPETIIHHACEELRSLRQAFHRLTLQINESGESKAKGTERIPRKEREAKINAAIEAVLRPLAEKVNQINQKYNVYYALTIQNNELVDFDTLQSHVLKELQSNRPQAEGWSREVLEAIGESRAQLEKEKLRK